jgi:ABC-2 type transport system ATP-binding protein
MAGGGVVVTSAQPDPDQRGRPSVSARELVVRVGRRTVLDGVTLELEEGVVVLAGPNGSGKTTLLRVLASLRRAAGGEVEVAGLSALAGRNLRETRRRTGYLAQEPTQHAHLRVREAIEYAAWLKGLGPKSRQTSVDDVLAALDLCDWSRHRLTELSGGTRRRAHLAQALVHKPSVLLLDEPTNGVDAEHRLEFRSLLRRIAANRLVVLSTHLTEDIELLADRVVVLGGGRVKFDGTPEGLGALGAQGASDSTDHLDLGPSRAVERGLRAVTATR